MNNLGYTQDLLDDMKDLADKHGVTRVEVDTLPDSEFRGVLYLTGLGWTARTWSGNWGNAKIIGHDS